MSRKLRLIFHSGRYQENTKKVIKSNHIVLDSQHISLQKYVYLNKLEQNPELQWALEVEGHFSRGRISSRKLWNFIALPFLS